MGTEEEYAQQVELGNFTPVPNSKFTIVDDEYLNILLGSAGAYWDAVSAFHEVGYGPLSTTLGWCLRARTLIRNPEPRNALQISAEWPRGS